jgi:cyclophilin family peptidyl-prolyl cis-trans isomerase
MRKNSGSAGGIPAAPTPPTFPTDFALRSSFEMQVLSIRALFIALWIGSVSVALVQPATAQEAGAEPAADQAAQEVASGRPAVELETSEGTILIELDPDKAPKTVANFLEYVASGHYAGTVFHRVIDGFMIQGGGLDEKLQEKQTLPPVPNEASNGLKNKKYTIAMARTNDPDSATCQFFINTADNSFLDRNEAQGNPGYTVFGRVVKGLEVVDKIGKTATYARPNPAFPAMLMRDVPTTPIVIKSIKARQ